MIDGQTFVPGQANNAYIFPGVGLGVLASEASRVTDEMFTAAAKSLVQQVTADDLKIGRIYPSLALIREVSANIAVAVAKVVFARGLTQCLNLLICPAISNQSCMIRPIKSTSKRDASNF